VDTLSSEGQRRCGIFHTSLECLLRKCERFRVHAQGRVGEAVKNKMERVCEPYCL
jgi:hypothetical protein